MDAGYWGPGLIAPTIDEQIAAEVDKIKQALATIEELQKLKKASEAPPITLPGTFPVLPLTPYSPYAPYPVPTPYMPMPMFEVTMFCEVCKMSSTGPAGYVCGRNDCPTKATCYTSANTK